MAELSPEVQQEIMQLQNLQRQLQLVAAQRQRFDIDMLQIDGALSELGGAKGKTYKAVGTLLIESDAKSLQKELTERKETTTTRIEALKKQEDKLKSKADELQKTLEKKLEAAK